MYQRTALDESGMVTLAQGTVWAIVLHYRLWRETVQCVLSLLDSDYGDLQVLVVDNGSADDSAVELERHLDRRVKLLTLPENRLYGGGMNAGLTCALEQGADWLLILNNDTFVAPDMVTRLVHTAQSNLEVGAVAPLVYYASEPTRVWNAGGRRRRFWPFAHQLGQTGYEMGRSEEPIDIDYATGCAMLLSRTVLERVGLFDPRYRMYYEDADLCERINHEGYRILIDPQAHMWHLVGRTAATIPAPNRYHRVRNRWRFYMAHTQGVSKALAALLLLGQEGLRGLAYAAKGSHVLARAQWDGLLDSLRNGDGRHG